MIRTDKMGVAGFADVPKTPNSLETLQATCREEITARCVRLYGPQLRSIILTGSLARGEATFSVSNGRAKLLGDAELILVFHESSPLPEALGVGSTSRSAEAALARIGLECHVELAAVHPKFLRRTKPHIFAYELRDCGRVLWGDRNILRLIPAFAPSAIPREDAWQLLCNRMIEMLELAADLTVESKGLLPGLIYRTVKLYLDMATSLLLFAGAYESTYQRRAERLESLAGRSSDPMEFPFDLRQFSQRVTLCTRWKLSATREDDLCTLLTDGESSSASWEEAVAYARLLWTWELERLTHCSGQVPIRELMKKWMRSQRLWHRLRGWLYVLRREAWFRSRREWRRWARLAWQASPRYWVYAAASELFFRLPCLALQRSVAPQVNGDWKQVYEWLPRHSSSEQAVEEITWRALAAEIVANYESFLTGTRS